jgi:hypothetical protein
MPSQLTLLLLLLHQHLLLRQMLLQKRLRSNSWQSKKNPALRGFFSPDFEGLNHASLNHEGLNHEAL